MGKDEILKKLVEYFEKKGIKVDLQKDLNKDYLWEGWIDSFDLINFISYIETEFGITLEPEDTESFNFRTLQGLVQIIEQKLQGEK